jgi:hypothetical protein
VAGAPRTLRRAGDSGALEELEKIGAPASPADPDWWVELGETLLAKARRRPW